MRNAVVDLEFKAYLVIFFSLCHRDGNLPVSFVQKYLMRKLDLSSESEVKELTSFSLVEILVLRVFPYSHFSVHLYAALLVNSYFIFT